MGSVTKVLNPVKVIKGTISAIKGDGGGGSAPAQEQGPSEEEKKAAANQAQYQAKMRTDNQADVSGVRGYGSDMQASKPTNALAGLGGVSKDELKLSKRKSLGV